MTISRVNVGYIKIEDSTVLNKRVLVSKISYSKNLAKYFASKVFWVKYDRDIQDVNASFLGIPVLSNIITVAWLTGADVYLKDLDHVYLHSLQRIQVLLKKWLPHFPLSTKLHVENIASNKGDNQKDGLLFSGGLDSTTSYIKHRAKKPNLIMVWGADIPLNQKEFWGKVASTYRKFAVQDALEINVLKTNMREFLNEDRLDLEFGRYLMGTWWEIIQNGMAILGITAPLTIRNKIGTIVQASSYSQRLAYPQLSNPQVINKLAWGGVKVVHDDYKTSRQEKIGQVLKPYLMNTLYQFPIRVCYSQFRTFNCNKCEKCYRTITGLILENIDPNAYGFQITGTFFEAVKQFLMRSKTLTTHANTNYLWNDIISHIPETLSHDLYRAQAFFNWLRGFDLAFKQENTINPLWYLFNLYARLPKRLQNLMKRLQFFFGSLKLNFSMV